MNLNRDNRGVSKVVIILVIILVLGLGALVGLFFKVKSDIDSKPGKDTTKEEQNDKEKQEASATPEDTPEATPEISTEVTPTTEPADPNKKPTFTLMVYLVGADLETNHGLASKQIKEIMDAKSSENVNIVIQTGGAKKWHTPSIKSGEVQRFSIENNKLVKQKDLGKVSMAEEKTLEDFIKWSIENYPADRYGICFNNHGGTATNGYGCDEVFGGTLLLDEIEQAFANGTKDSKAHFDFIAFDACTMSTFETAYILSSYADYLVASESVIYSYHGFEYTEFINLLAEDSNTKTVNLCKQMANDLEAANLELKKQYSKATYTIAVTDLSKMKGLYKTMCGFMKELDGYLLNGKTATNVANLRYHTKYFGSPENDFIDIVDFAKKCKIKSTDSVEKAIKEAVIYSLTDIADSCGMGMYMPYNYLSAFNTINNTVFPYITDKGYQKCLYDMANLVAYCREPNNKYKWYDASIGEACMEYITPISESETIEVTKNADGVYEWKFDQATGYKIASVLDKFYIYSGDTIYYMGSRDVSAQTGDSIKLEFSNTWYALNNTLIPVIYQGRDQKIDGTNYTYSYIPAEVTKTNGTVLTVYLVAYFDYGRQDGEIIGYQMRNTKFDTMQQNTLQLEKGDKIGISYLKCDNNAKVTEESKNSAVFTYAGGQIPLTNVKIVANQKYALQKELTDYFGRKYQTKFYKSTTE